MVGAKLVIDNFMDVIITEFCGKKTIFNGEDDVFCEFQK